jgi:tetratricopeptide (TPR) repeat protein
MSQQEAKEATPDTSPRLDEEGEGPRTSFSGFLVPVALVAGLGGAGLFFYHQRIVTERTVAEYLVKARDTVKKHDLGSLKDAEALLKQALEVDEDPRALALMAMDYVYQSEHGLDTLGEAERFLKQAVDEGAETPHRYATDAYLKIERGNAAQAEREVDDLMKGEVGGPEMAHALGWAKAENGQLIEGSRIIRAAQQGDSSAIAFSITLAEIMERQGKDREAAKSLRGVLAQNANPAHGLARAWLAGLELKAYGDLVSPLQHMDLVREKLDGEGPRTRGLYTLAEGELALALGQPDQALAKAKEAAAALPNHAPVLDLEARALLAKGSQDEAVATYRKAMELKPEYAGPAWALARLLSQRKDDGALAIAEQLEKRVQGTKGPEFELFRGEHFLRQGKLEDAKAALTRAADLGDDAMILLGLARVTFAEEQAKGAKADIEKVGEALSQALERLTVFPEAQEVLADVQLWNFMVDAAHEAWNQADAGYKKQNRSIVDMNAFYDRVVAALDAAKDPRVKGPATAKAAEWRKRKADYLEATKSALSGK